ncbi:MAG: AEC family transporter [Deltaproteobacteria bacterium]|jgi:predicted permease|nr:AEC family transporter [Deltaproteobacteria bacterium]
MENLIIIFFLLLLGMALSRVKIFPENASQVLNLFIIYISLPALILVQVPRLTFSKTLLVPVLMPWAMLVVSALLVLAASTLLRWPREITGTLLLVVPLGNTSFFGIPMVKAFWGMEAISYAVLYDQFGSFLALTTYGSIILAVYSGSEKPTPAGILKRICLFPPFIALVIGLLTMSIPYPAVLTAVLEGIAASLVPVVMVAIGLQIKLKLAPGNWTPFGVGLAIKLVAAPLAATCICLMLNQHSLAAKVSVFEAGMPPMVTAGALALLAGLAPELTAALVGLGLMLSFMTLSLLFQILQLL